MNRLPALLLVFLVAGCALHPKPETEWNLPASFSAAPGGQPAVPGSPWWNSFSDETLASLMASLLEHNHDLAKAEARLRQLLAEAESAQGARLPELSLSAASSRRRQNFIGLPLPGAAGVVSSTSTQHSGLLNLSWELDLWGRLKDLQHAGLAQLAAGEADLEGARLLLTTQAARLYFQALESNAQLELARESKACLDDQYSWLAQRAHAGFRTKRELDQLLLQRQVQEAVVHQRQLQRDALARQLQALNQCSDCATPLAFASSLPPLPPAVPSCLPGDLIARRPDLVAAESRLLASGYQVQAARKLLYPRISLSASAGGSSDELSRLLDGDFSVWNLAGNLLQSLFQGGRLRAQVRAREAQREQALHEFIGRAFQAYVEVEQALEAEVTLRRREESAAQAWRTAEQGKLTVEARHAAGLLEWPGVLDARRQELYQRGEWLLARRLLLENRVLLISALGGSWYSNNLESEL
jgi:NodT family efflux transporter outer membrane factor (OMF) lipoprotein